MVEKRRSLDNLFHIIKICRHAMQKGKSQSVTQTKCSSPGLSIKSLTLIYININMIFNYFQEKNDQKDGSISLKNNLQCNRRQAFLTLHDESSHTAPLTVLFY